MGGKAKTVLLVTAFILLGLAALLIGGTMAGWDIIGWFSSKTAIFLYVILAVYLVGATLIIVNDKIDKLR